MQTIKLILKWLLGVLFMLAGINHFVSPDFYLKIMPTYLPWHLFLIYVSGFFEVALGVMLLTRSFARVAAWGLIALLLAVLPANVHMALNPELYPDINPAALWARLPLQAVLIGWAYRYTRPGVRQRWSRRVRARASF
ncbi:MAG: DoxX family membrane protein [Pyrinomonadaceae bacterium]|nr:DoxX family membrane protein [Pyrinomonadaceae bacterium]